MTTYRWQPISPLAEAGDNDFSEIDSLQRQWRDIRDQEKDDPAYTAFLRRLIRSWAIETGVIEGLYTLDRGMTKTLVERGISADLIERSATNKEPQELAAMLKDNQDAVDGVYQEIKESRPISRSAIRQIHQTLTRHQPTYHAMDQFGKWFEAKLDRGGFKKLPNNPTRPDGLVHEYCPPEQVDSELDNLFRWYSEYQQDTTRHHPLLTAAWLHHRFTQIHPFQDGNGRVARTLLTWHLVREGYLPVVITRDDRERYIDALESSDRGDLVPFASLLAELQKQAILDALGTQEEISDQFSLVGQVLDHFVTQINLQEQALQAEMRSVNTVAQNLRDSTTEWLQEQSEQISSSLEVAGRKVRYFTDAGGPDDEREHWYAAEVVRTANNSGHWVNRDEPMFFAKLSITSDDPSSRQPRLVFVLSLHNTGRQLTGIMAATAFARFERRYAGVEENTDVGRASDEFLDCTLSPFTFTWKDETASLQSRFRQWTEQRLAVALRDWLARYL